MSELVELRAYVSPRRLAEGRQDNTRARAEAPSPGGRPPRAVPQPELTEFPPQIHLSRESREQRFPGLQTDHAPQWRERSCQDL
jgi:hypothetical protein